jgi:hypothetical protein
MVGLVQVLPEHGSRTVETPVLLAALAGAALLIAAVFWLLARRVTAAAWVGRFDDGGPKVWRVPARARPPEQVRRPVSWGSDDTYADALADAVLRRIRWRPSRAVAREFADEVLRDLPDDGFVLHERAVRTWLRERTVMAEPSDREAIR